MRQRVVTKNICFYGILPICNQFLDTVCHTETSVIDSRPALATPLFDEIGSEWIASAKSNSSAKGSSHESWFSCYSQTLWCPHQQWQPFSQGIAQFFHIKIFFHLFNEWNLILKGNSGASIEKYIPISSWWSSWSWLPLYSSPWLLNKWSPLPGTQQEGCVCCRTGFQLTTDQQVLHSPGTGPHFPTIDRHRNPDWFVACPCIKV